MMTGVLFLVLYLSIFKNIGDIWDQNSGFWIAD